MSLFKGVSSKKIIDAVIAGQAGLDTKLTDLLTEHGDTQALLTTVRDALIAEIDQNQALIEGLSSVDGSLDSTATAVNSHTTAKANEILNALSSTELGSLRKVLLDAIGANATPQNVTDAQTAILAAISGISSGQSVIHSIQRGRWFGTIEADSFKNITISSVDRNKSMLNAQAMNSAYNPSNNVPIGYVSYQLYNSSTIQVHNRFGSPISVALSWEVVRFV